MATSNTSTLLAIAAFVAILPMVADAQTSTPQPAAQTSPREFGGVEFGVGFSLTKDTGDRDRVEEAVVDDLGFVRVNKRGNSIARVMLEMHYFFVPDKQERFGFGPFMSVQPGSNEIISAIGAGLMVGLRRAKSSQSFNIGVGLSADPTAKILGAGLVENAKAPLTAEGKPTAIRLEQDDQFGLLLLFDVDRR
jgi:hypothetical protein